MSEVAPSSGRKLLRIGLLGDFSVEAADGRLMEMSTRKNRGLLAILALSPNMTASRERLAGLLWSDRGEEQARNSLRQSLAILRRELDHQDGQYLHVRDETLKLLGSEVFIDALEFLRLAGASDVEPLRAAAALYRGDLFDGSGIRDAAYDEWASVERARLHQSAIQVLDRLASLETGRAKLAAAQRLVELDPLREASHRLLMQSFADDGETALALRQFETCQRLLRDELGVDPAPATIELSKQIAGGLPAAADPARPHGIQPPTLPAKPTIAVLPFANLGGDSEQDYFSDGITEGIITELSRFKNMYVIARNSSFAYRSRAIGLDVIARELGAGYVLEGSVRRLGTHVRIAAQLSDVKTGSQIWGEHFDREVTDIFTLQDELARNIAGILAIELDDRELERANWNRLENVKAYEHWLRGKRFLWTAGQSNLEARRHFASAVEADPGLARAHAGLAVTYIEEAVEFPPENEFKVALAKAEESAQQALQLDPSECLGHIALSWAYLYRHDYGRLKRHSDIALRLNPNDSDMLGNATYVLAMYGNADEAVRAGETAIKLNPRYPDWYCAFLGTALFVARRHEEAINIRMRAPEPFFDSRFFGAASLAHLGRIDEARKWASIAMERLIGRLGGAAVAEKGAVQLLLDNNPMQRAEDREHFAEGMRKAGVPG